MKTVIWWASKLSGCTKNAGSTPTNRATVVMPKANPAILQCKKMQDDRMEHSIGIRAIRQIGICLIVQLIRSDA